MYTLKRVFWKIDVWKCFIFLWLKSWNWVTLKVLLFDILKTGTQNFVIYFNIFQKNYLQ